jgi:hypothetical protein
MEPHSRAGDHDKSQDNGERRELRMLANQNKVTPAPKTYMTKVKDRVWLLRF